MISDPIASPALSHCSLLRQSTMAALKGEQLCSTDFLFPSPSPSSSVHLRNQDSVGQSKFLNRVFMSWTQYFSQILSLGYSKASLVEEAWDVQSKRQCHSDWLGGFSRWKRSTDGCSCGQTDSWQSVKFRIQRLREARNRTRVMLLVNTN